MATLWYRSNCYGNMPECNFRPHGDLKSCDGGDESPAAEARRRELIELTGDRNTHRTLRLVIHAGHEDQVAAIAGRLSRPFNEFTSETAIVILAAEGLPHLGAAA